MAAIPIPKAAAPTRGVELVPGLAKFVTLVSGIAVIVHLVLRFLAGAPQAWAEMPLYGALTLGGAPIVAVLTRKLLAREFGSDFLAGVSIVTAVALRQYLVATIVILMLSSGAALETFAARRASRVLEMLAKRMPAIAHRKIADAMMDVAAGEIAAGEILVVLPHEICPVDGVIVEGRGSMNEAYLTGEPFEVEKAPGATVLSGALNGGSLLTIRAGKRSTDSRYASIMRVMEETQQRRPRLRRLGDMLGGWYTPLAVGLAVLVWILSGNVERFLAVLVIATPCPLLIAIPVAVIGGVSLCARRGIIIKNPAVLEQIDSCRTFIFDKTGTLTCGKPALTRIVCAPGLTEGEVLKATASLERYSKHPLASAIVEAARQRRYDPLPVSEVSEPPGQGLQGTVSGRRVLLTGRNHVAADRLALPSVQPGLECLVFLDGRFAALLGFEDSPREESRVFLKHLRPRHRVDRVMLVSGDREAEVRSLAEKVGIRVAHGATTPEEKVELVRAETERAKTVYVGDGINDAPAMQAATVGIAFGHENVITNEAADAVVLDRSLGKIDELIHIGGRMRKIALESAIGGMVLSVAGMALAAFGWLAPIGGAVAQEIIDLAAVLNAVRAALPTETLRDF